MLILNKPNKTYSGNKSKEVALNPQRKFIIFKRRTFMREKEDC